MSSGSKQFLPGTGLPRQRFSVERFNHLRHAMEASMTDPETKTQKSLTDLTADLTALREDFMKLSTSVRDLVQTQATSTTKRVAGAVGDARHKLSNEMASAKDQLEGHLGAMTT